MYGKCVRIFTVYCDGNFKWFQVIPKKTGNVIEMMDGMQIIINYVNIYIYIHTYTHTYIYTPSRCTRVPFAHYGSLYFRTSDVCSVLLLRKISNMHLPSILKLGTPGQVARDTEMVLYCVMSDQLNEALIWWPNHMPLVAHAGWQKFVAKAQQTHQAKVCMMEKPIPQQTSQGVRHQIPRGNTLKALEEEMCLLWTKLIHGCKPSRTHAHHWVVLVLVFKLIETTSQEIYFQPFSYATLEGA
jgi:hypothetical protein